MQLEDKTCSYKIKTCTPPENLYAVTINYYYCLFEQKQILKQNGFTEVQSGYGAGRNG